MRSTTGSVTETPAPAQTPTGLAATAGAGFRVAAICAFVAFADGYDVSALGMAIPLMAADFSVVPTAFTGAATASLAGMAIGAVGLSPMADRYGHWQTLIALLLLIGATTLGAMFAASPNVLAGWRFFSGLGLGAVVPIGIALTAMHAPPKRRALFVTVMVSFTGVGVLFAGFLAPTLVAWMGWRGIFLLGAILPGLAALLAAYSLYKTPRSETAGETKSVLKPKASVLQGLRESLFAVRGLFAPEFRRVSIFIWALFWLNLFVNYSLISWLPTLLTGAGWSVGEAARATGLIAIAGITGGVIISALTDVGWIKRTYAAAYLLAAVIFFLFLIAGDNRTVWIVLILAVGLTSFGTQIALSSVAALYYPDSIRSTAIGWCSGFGRIGSVVGPMVLAALMAAKFSSTFILAALTVPMLACVLCVMFLPPVPSSQNHQ